MNQLILQKKIPESDLKAVGMRSALQDQRLRRIDVRPTDDLSVDQTVQKIQKVGFGCHAFSQRHFHGDQHGLFIMLKACLRHDMLQNQCQDIDHLPITARFA